MYLVGIAWLYVALMMALAEASSTQGTVLGAIFTFLLYGLLPISIVLYVLGSPRRKAARKQAEAEALRVAQSEAIGAPSAAPSAQSDGGSHATTDTVAPEGEKSTGLTDRAP